MPCGQADLKLLTGIWDVDADWAVMFPKFGFWGRSKPHRGLCLLIDKICFGWSTFSWSLVLSPQNKIWSTPWKCFMELPQPDQNLALLGSLMLWCEWVKFGLDYHEESQGKAFVLTLTYVDRKRGLNEWFRPVVFNNNSNYWIIGANLQSLEHFYILCIKQRPINGYGCANMDAYLLQTLSQKCFMGPHRDLSQSSNQAIWPRPRLRQPPVHTRCLCCDTLHFVWMKTIRFPKDDFEMFCQQYALDRTSHLGAMYMLFLKNIFPRPKQKQNDHED